MNAVTTGSTAATAGSQTQRRGRSSYSSAIAALRRRMEDSPSLSEALQYLESMELCEEDDGTRALHAL